MPDPIWTKTKAEFVIEIMHEQFGPKRDWKLAGYPDHLGTPTRAKFDRTIELLAELIGAAPNGVELVVSAVSGRTWRDPAGIKWIYWIVAKAIEIGFITPEEAPPLGEGISTNG